MAELSKPIVNNYILKFIKSFFNKKNKSDIASRMAKSVFWSMAGALISRGLMLIASIIVARILGKEVYGEFGIIRSTVNMFFVFAGFGLGMTATKYVAEYRVSDPDRAGQIIVISELFAIVTGLLVAVAVVALAPLLAEKSLNAPHLTGVLRIGALILFINALNGAQTGALAGFEAFKTIAKVNTGVGLTSFPLLTLGTWFGGLKGAVWALAANMAINWLLNNIALRKELTKFNVSFTFSKSFKELPILWKFSLPATLSSIMVSPVLWVCDAMLVNQPDGFSQMAIFSAANQWKIAILFIPGMICQIVLPMLSNLKNPNQNDDYIKILKYNIYINAGVSLIMASIVSLFSKFIMNSYGLGFNTGKWVLLILAFSSVLISINSVIGQAIASKNLMWYGLLFNGLWAVVLFIVSLFFLRLGMGAIGLALANLIAYMLHTLWQFAFLLNITFYESKHRVLE